MTRIRKVKPSRKVKPAKGLPITPATIAERERLMTFARFAKGDPLLSAFEEAFVISMQRLGEDPTGPLPSEKQRTIFDQIARKIGFECEPEQRSVEDSDAADEWAVPNYDDDDFTDVLRYD